MNAILERELNFRIDSRVSFPLNLTAILPLGLQRQSLTG